MIKKLRIFLLIFIFFSSSGYVVDVSAKSLYLKTSDVETLCKTLGGCNPKLKKHLKEMLRGMYTSLSVEKNYMFDGPGWGMAGTKSRSISQCEISNDECVAIIHHGKVINEKFKERFLKIRDNKYIPDSNSQVASTTSSNEDKSKLSIKASDVDYLCKAIGNCWEDNRKHFKNSLNGRYPIIAMNISRLFSQPSWATSDNKATALRNCNDLGGKCEVVINNGVVVNKKLANKLKNLMPQYALSNDKKEICEKATTDDGNSFLSINGTSKNYVQLAWDRGLTLYQCNFLTGRGLFLNDQVVESLDSAHSFCKWKSTSIGLPNFNYGHQRKLNQRGQCNIVKENSERDMIGGYKITKYSKIKAKEFCKYQKHICVNLKSETQVAESVETTTQVVQVPESKVDKEAPVLEIEERITVTERNYSISGKVVDENDVFVEANGNSWIVSNNSFTIKGSTPLGLNEIEVIAFDAVGNETSKKIIIERIIQTADSTSSFEKLNPEKLRSKANKDRIALIIGIEEYKNISSANYAKRDAEFFIDYVQGAFGVPQNNIKYFFNSDAVEQSKFQIKDWLKRNVRNNTEIYVYFSGHGIALDEGEELYLLTHDTIAEYIDETALNRNEIFNDIAQYNPKSVTAFLDTCYSGAGRADGEMLLAMAKGLVVVDENQQKLPDNFTLFTAASAQESAWSLPEAQHGTFSYFLMKGMEGNADLNGDNKLTNGELRDYLLDNVGRYAQQQQTPQMVGDPNQVLMRF